MSDGLTAVPVADDDDADVDEDMPGETRGGRFDLVATVRAVRPLKIESSSCSGSGPAPRALKMSRRSGWRPWKYAVCAFSLILRRTGWWLFGVRGLWV